MAQVDEDRIARVLAEATLTHERPQLLITDPWSIYYLTGFYAEMYERFSGVLISAGDTPVIFNNVLYPIDSYDNARVVDIDDADDLISILATHIDAGRDLGVDGHIRADFLLPLEEAKAARSIYLASALVARVRAHKDASERELMRTSSAINDRVMAKMPELLHEGATEHEIAAGLLALYKADGAEGFSFDPIVSFGANAADPHHVPDDTVLHAGEVALFDIGGRYSNYCSDMTRTFFFGDVDEESKRIYDIVRHANEAAEEIIKPGVRFCDIDRCAREIIEDAGYGPYFTHRLGHSIGLQDHEPGDVSSANEACVEAGMTFSIEPGIYLPGRTGVRIEDLVLVTETGCEVLNGYTKEPVTIEAR